VLYSRGLRLLAGVALHLNKLTGASAVAELALTVAASLLVPTAIGFAVDQKLGSTPWALLAGALVGIAFATIGLTRIVLKRYERLAPPSDD
jgi:F0F1-type ATP synthase assembly protein I